MPDGATGGATTGHELLLAPTSRWHAVNVHRTGTVPLEHERNDDDLVDKCNREGRSITGHHPVIGGT